MYTKVRGKLPHVGGNISHLFNENYSARHFGSTNVVNTQPGTLSQSSAMGEVGVYLKLNTTVYAVRMQQTRNAVKLGYGDTNRGKPKESLFTICHYTRPYDFRPNMYIHRDQYGLHVNTGHSFKHCLGTRCTVVFVQVLGGSDALNSPAPCTYVTLLCPVVLGHEWHLHGLTFDTHVTIVS